MPKMYRPQEANEEEHAYMKDAYRFAYYSKTANPNVTPNL